MRPEDLRETHARPAGGAGQDLHGTAGRGGSPAACNGWPAVGCHLYGRAYVRTPEEGPARISTLRERGSARPGPEHKRFWAKPGAVRRGGYPGDVRRGGAPGSEKTESAGSLWWMAIFRRWSSRADGGGAEHPAISFRPYPLAQYVWEGGGPLPPPGDRSRSLDARAPAGNSRGKGQSGGRRACGAVPPLRKMAAAERKLWTTVATFLNSRRIFSTTGRWPRGFPSPLGSLKAPVVHLVKDRMNLTGARGSLTGAEAVLRLRALRHSNDFRCLLGVFTSSRKF